jgi:aerotaxis receptor
VARAADEQRSATSEIMKSAATAAEHTRLVAENVRDMLQQAEATGETAKQVDQLSAQVGQNISTLQRRLYVILHTSRGGDRRAELRTAVAIKFRAQFGSVNCDGYTGDISAGGALLVAAQPIKAKATNGFIEFDGIGRIDAAVVAQLETGMRVKFESIDPAQATALVNRVAELSEADKPLLGMVENVADDAASALNKAIEEGAISHEDLFDLHYDPIAGTDPEQVLAKHTKLVERLFPPLIEPPLGANSNIVMCCIADRGGYIAAHNQKYSQRQRPGDREWNFANARNRRVFDDSAGILAARCTRPQIQIYARQMGKGGTMLLREFDAPIKIGRRRWGAVRLALKLA